MKKHLIGALSHIVFIVSLSSTAFGMDQTASMQLDFCHVPREIHKIFFTLSDLRSQDRLRETCHYWKKIGNERTDNGYLLHSLHNLHDSTEYTKTRVLFYAIHNDDFHLTKYILEKTPDKQLYLPFFNNCDFNPCNMAHIYNNKEIIKLFEQHGYEKKRFNQYKQPKDADWPQEPILRELLIASIIGDNNSLKKILCKKFTEKEFVDAIVDKDEQLSMNASILIENCFEFITRNDDELSIIPCIEFIQNNPEMNYLINFRLLPEACEKRSIKVLKKILKNIADINKITICNSNGTMKLRTLKDELLDMHSDNYQSSEHYNEIEALLNEFGAKTVEELQPQTSNSTQNVYFCTIS